MARKPNVQSDRDNWGDVLNDYLDVSLNDDGTLREEAVAPTVQAVADTLYPDKDATEAALGRVDPGEAGTDGKVLGWVGSSPGAPDWVDPPAGGEGENPFEAGNTPGPGTDGKVLGWVGSPGVPDWVEQPSGLTQAVADTLYPAKAATEAALERSRTRGPWDSREWGIDSDGNDHAADFATMVSELASEDNRAVRLPSGDIPLGSTIQVGMRGLSLLGTRGDRPGDAGGTRLIFDGTGPAIQIGTDSGQPYDNYDYDGYQDFTLEGISFKYVGSATTALANGLGNYGTGTYAIRDWRGGNVRLTDVLIENFAYGFWGVQSDLNLWTRPQFRYCGVGAYFGPHSDQPLILQPYSFANDVLYHFDSVRNATIVGMTTHDDGSASTPAIRIGSDGWNLGSYGIHFLNCVFEHTSMFSGTIPAFVDIGVGESVTSSDVVITNPILALNDDPTFVSPYRTTALVRVDNGDRITIEHPSGPARQLRALVQNVGANDPRIRIIAGEGEMQNLAVENTSTGTALVQTVQWGGAENVAATVALAATIGTTETTVPHGLPYTPAVLGIVPKADARVWESTPPDSENVYLTASVSAAVDILLGPGSAQAAFATDFLIDTFTDTDGTALGSHTPDTGTWAGSVGHYALQVQSNRIAATADFQRPMVDTGDTDHRVAVTINLGDDGSQRQAGIVFRGVDASNYWAVAPLKTTTAQRLEVIRVVAGTFTTVRRKYLDLDANTDYRLTAEARGDVLRVTVDGLPALTLEGINDVHPTGTYAGFAILYRGSGTATATADDLEIRTP